MDEENGTEQDVQKWWVFSFLRSRIR